MRRPEGCCPDCWQPHPPSQKRCFGPPVAVERDYGELFGRLDRLEGWLLDATHPRQDTARGAHGFQIEEARDLAALLRSALADGSLALDDLAPPAYTSTEHPNG